MYTVDSLDEIKKKLKINPGGPVEYFFTETCYRYMDKYVPMDTGNLRTIVDLGSNYITYMSPYATYQYKGVREDGTHTVNPDNYTTPGTGPYWDQRMLTADSDNVLTEVEEYMRRLYD